MNAFIALDVGGTQIKSAILAEGRLSSISRDAALAREDAETIVGNLAGIIAARQAELTAQGHTLAGVGLAFPGPFDYARGISLLRGIGKYDSIYGLDLRSRLAKICGLAGERFAFQNDADLFCLGEAAFGTGLGSGFVEKGRLVKSGPRVPENGWVYSLPYQGGTVDQYLSATGLARMLRESGLFHPDITVREAADLARQGDPQARKIFAEFGARLEEVIPPISECFGAECLVIGGQVAKSSALFCEGLERTLKRLGTALRVSADSSASAMRAVPLLFRSAEEGENHA